MLLQETLQQAQEYHKEIRILHSQISKLYAAKEHALVVAFVNERSWMFKEQKWAFSSPVYRSIDEMVTAYRQDHASGQTKSPSSHFDGFYTRAVGSFQTDIKNMEGASNRVDSDLARDYYSAADIQQKLNNEKLMHQEKKNSKELELEIFISYWNSLFLDLESLNHKAN